MTRALVKLSPEKLALLEVLATIDLDAEEAELERATAIVAMFPLELRGLLPAIAAMRVVQSALRVTATAIPSREELRLAMALAAEVPQATIDRAIEDFEARRH